MKKIIATLLAVCIANINSIAVNANTVETSSQENEPGVSCLYVVATSIAGSIFFKNNLLYCEIVHKNECVVNTAVHLSLLYSPDKKKWNEIKQWELIYTNQQMIAIQKTHNVTLAGYYKLVYNANVYRVDGTYLESVRTNYTSSYYRGSGCNK